MRIFFACEGKSEEKFIESILLNPYLRFSEAEIDPETRNMGGSAGFVRRIGGLVDIAIGDSGADAVFGLTDLHGAPIDVAAGGSSEVLLRRTGHNFIVITFSRGLTQSIGTDFFLMLPFMNWRRGSLQIMRQ